MEQFRFITVALLGLCFLPVPGGAQDGPSGTRSVSVMGGTFSGAFSSSPNVPMVASRYRVRTARLGVVEAELGAGRVSDRDCLTAVSTGTFLDCDEDPYTMFVGGLNWVVSTPAGALRPYAHAGIGAAHSTDFGAAAFGVVGAGMAVRVFGGFSARAEVGRRLNGSGGAMHAWSALNWTSRVDDAGRLNDERVRAHRRPRESAIRPRRIGLTVPMPQPIISIWVELAGVGTVRRVGA